MTISADRCVSSALNYGCNSSVVFRENHIDRDFFEANKSVLEDERGAGFWLWKPYFILQQLNRSENGDIIIYTDAGLDFVTDINKLLKEMKGDIMLFGNGWRHGDWCKTDVLKAMDCEEYADRQQCQASCVIVRKSEESVAFIAEWLAWCQKPGFIDDSQSVIVNPEGWREHRHDQAILTNMAYLYGIGLNRWPAQYKLQRQDEFSNQYPMIFHHHRKRNNEY